MASRPKAPPRSRGKRGGNEAEISARLQQLYALPLADFTRARDALAKELASEGHAKEAQETRKLKRPVLAAWAVNQLVHLHPEDVEELLAAARTLEKAQRQAMSGLAPEPLKEANRAFQRALDTLMNHVNAALDASGRAAAGELIRQVDETLRAASLGSEEERSALAQGMLTRPLRSPGLLGNFSSLQLVGPASARGPRKTAPTPPSKRPEPVPSPTGGKVLQGPWAPRDREAEPPPRAPPPPKKPTTPPAPRRSKRELRAEAKAQARRDREVELRELQREARQQAQQAERSLRSARQNVVRTKALLRTAEGRTRYARAALEAAETRAQRAREALEAQEEQVRQAREAFEAIEATEREQAQEVSRASREAETAEEALTQAQRRLKHVESRRPH